MMVSMTQNAVNPQTRDVETDVILRAIQSGRWKQPVEHIRCIFGDTLLRTGDLQAAKRAISPLKCKLSGALWSGRFKDRHNKELYEHSGLLCADPDSLGARLLDIREKLQNSPHVFALFVSPSGDGLKVIFRVPADGSKHPGSFRAAEKLVRELTGVEIDKSGKDVARLCFMSYDPDLYHNPDAIEIEPLPEPEKTKPPSPNSESPPNLSKPDKAQVREMLAFIPKRPHYGDWITIVAAVGDALSEPDAIEVLNEWSPEEEPGEYAAKLRSGFTDVHIGTLIYLAKEQGWTGNLRTLPRVEAKEAEPVELPPPPPPYGPPPLDLLPSQLQDYVYAAAKSLNVDVSFILLPLLGSLGSAIGKARSILLKRGFIQPPVIWTGIIGRSGSRKSPSLDLGCFGVLEHERDLMRQNRDAQTEYQERFAEWDAKTKLRGPKPQLPDPVTCVMDKLTFEALARTLPNSPSLLIKKDELSHWFESMDQYHGAKGADVGQWVSLHTAVLFAFDRSTDKRSDRIWQPRVCIAGGIQPKVLRRILTEDFFERGLPARFLFAHPPFIQDRWSDDTVPDNVRNAVLKLFAKLWLLQPEDKDGRCDPKLLTLDEDVKAIFVEFYDECGAASTEAGEQEEAAWCKLAGYAARLALVGQLARNPDAKIVTGEVMDAACDLARWSGKEAVRIYAILAETPAQREHRELIEFILKRGGIVSVRDVTHYYWRLKNQTEEAEWRLNQLVKKGFGKWEKVRPSGRGKFIRVFRLLQASPSPIRPDLRGKPALIGDGEAGEVEKITLSIEPETEARTEAAVGDEMGIGRL
jgi:hypothetical protein